MKGNRMRRNTQSKKKKDRGRRKTQKRETQNITQQ